MFGNILTELFHAMQIMVIILVFGIVFCTHAGAVTPDGNITAIRTPVDLSLSPQLPSHEEGFITISPIGAQCPATPFTVIGTTNLTPGTVILVDIFSADHQLGPRTTSASGAAATLTVINGSPGRNVWSYTADPTGWEPGNYTVAVSTTGKEPSAMATIFLGPGSAGCSLSGTQTPVMTPTSPGFTMAGALLPLAIAGLVVMRRISKR